MMARRRPGGAIAKEDFTDETNLWNSIVEKVKRAQLLNDKYEDLASKLATGADQPVPDDNRKSS